MRARLLVLLPLLTLTVVGVSGPNPRGLDRFPITVTDGEARIDLNT